MYKPVNHDALSLKAIEGIVNIQINGQSLIDMLAEHELPNAKSEGHEEIAGGYGFISVSEFRDIDEDEDGRVLLLNCGECGFTGCWSLYVKERREKGQVIWESFVQPHRPTWDYIGFGPFVFKEKQFDTQIGKLK